MENAAEMLMAQISTAKMFLAEIPDMGACMWPVVLFSVDESGLPLLSLFKIEFI